MSYLKRATDKTRVPQHEKLRDSQIKNSEGAYVFSVDRWNRLRRFLILGSEGGTYYVNERKLTTKNLTNVEACLKEDGVRVVNEVVEISTNGRAPKNDQAVYVLAMASCSPDLKTRKAAFANLHKVCRIGTHLYQFLEFRKSLGGGWGTNMRNAVANWFNKKPAEKLAYQVAKYKQREGWSARDALRKAHVVPESAKHEAIYEWVCGDVRPDKEGNVADRNHKYKGLILPPFLKACNAIKNASEKKAIELIKANNLPREVVPTKMLNSANVWEAMLEGMPIMAMVRNLGKMTSIGLLKQNSSAARMVCQKLGNEEAIQHSRIHPISVLIALKQYEEGHGLRGSLSWKPVRSILDALDDAFYTSFGNVEPTGKRMILGLDVSPSMGSSLGGGVMGISGLTPRMVACAMSMVTARTEKHDCYTMGFTHQFKDLKISRKDTLKQAMHKANSTGWGGTNCAMPMLWAMKNKIQADGFVIYTDNDTHSGRVHPCVALEQYRQKIGIDSKLVVCATTATHYTVCDPQDANSMDIAGFDSATPNIISDFVSARI
jgi:60 kDa SS-A/Ro ribonucleoprotein